MYPFLNATAHFTMNRIFTKMITITVLVVLLGCGQDKSKINDLAAASKFGSKYSSKYERDIDTVIYKPSYISINGSASVDKDKISEVYIKFEPYISFADFKVKNIYKGKKAQLNLNSHVDGTRFRTRLKQAYEKGVVNFAGHYCFVAWGCGSPCQQSMLIDLKTGKIYEAPTATLGFAIRKDSRMIVVNPPDSTGFYKNCRFCHPEIWIFNESRKEFVKVESSNDKYYAYSPD